MYIALEIAAWVVGGVIALGLGYLLFLLAWGMFGTSTPPGVDLRIDAPVRCEIEDEFDIVVRLTDTLGRERRINDIDIENEYLEGLAVMRVDPMPASSTRSFGDFSYSMKRTIPANGTQEVRFHCKAVKVGDFCGDITIYVDGVSLRYFTHNVRTIVSENFERRAAASEAAKARRGAPVTLI